MNLSVVENIVGYQVRCDGTSACIESIVQSIADGKIARWLASLNPHSYAVTLDRPAFDTALKAAEWLVPDGMGIVLASRFFGGCIRKRATGSDIFCALHERLQTQGGGAVLLLDSTEDTLAIIRSKVARDWPALEVAGTYSPPSSRSFQIQMSMRWCVGSTFHVRNVLWVGMSAPKQEEWIHRVIHSLDVCFAAVVGAVFDLYAGRIKRSHPVFQQLDLEWLRRLLQEPRRLWRRMFVSSPIFVWHVVEMRFMCGRE